jgi:hypothetical protein
VLVVLLKSLKIKYMHPIIEGTFACSAKRPQIMVDGSTGSVVTRFDLVHPILVEGKEVSKLFTCDNGKQDSHFGMYTEVTDDLYNLSGLILMRIGEDYWLV